MNRLVVRAGHHRYFVVLPDDRWMIQSDGAFYGPYPSQAHSINMAIDTALLAQGKSQVFVAKEKDGEGFELVWTFKVDAYPPPKPTKPRKLPSKAS